MIATLVLGRRRTNTRRYLLLFVTTFVAYCATSGPAVAVVHGLFAFGPQPNWVEAAVIYGYYPVASVANSDNRIASQLVNDYVDEWADLGVDVRHLFVNADHPHEKRPRPYICILPADA